MKCTEVLGFLESGYKWKIDRPSGRKVIKEWETKFLHV